MGLAVHLHEILRHRCRRRCSRVVAIHDPALVDRQAEKSYCYSYNCPVDWQALGWIAIAAVSTTAESVSEAESVVSGQKVVLTVDEATVASGEQKEKQQCVRRQLLSLTLNQE